MERRVLHPDLRTHAQNAWVTCQVCAFSSTGEGLYNSHRSKRKRQGLALKLRKSQERGTIMNVARTLNNWRKYRQTVAELGRMTPRELNDLGIAQSDIRRVARQAVGF
jgi:uncharacterized protein YjiS (DUF1127 family)